MNNYTTEFINHRLNELKALLKNADNWNYDDKYNHYICGHYKLIYNKDHYLSIRYVEVVPASFYSIDLYRLIFMINDNEDCSGYDMNLRYYPTEIIKEILENFKEIIFPCEMKLWKGFKRKSFIERLKIGYNAFREA